MWHGTWTLGAQLVRSTLVAASIAACAAGCGSRKDAPVGLSHTGRANEVMVRTVFDQAATNAAITERTVYPYHFRPNGASLNELGEDQLAMLAEAHRATPGELSVAVGDASPELHRARVETVVRQLEQEGVFVDKVTIGTKPQGGTGMTSVRVGQLLDGGARGSAMNTGAASGTGAPSPAVEPMRSNER